MLTLRVVDDTGAVLTVEPYKSFNYTCIKDYRVINVYVHFGGIYMLFVIGS